MTPTNIFEQTISSSQEAKNTENGTRSNPNRAKNAGESPEIALARIEYLLSWARREFGCTSFFNHQNN